MSETQYKPAYKPNERVLSVDFDYGSLDRGNGADDAETEAFRSAARTAMDFYRRVFMTIQDFDGGSRLALDCAMLALGWSDLANAKTQQDLAKRHKCGRANINRLVKRIQSLAEITPQIGQRDAATLDKFSKVRINQLKK